MPSFVDQPILSEKYFEAQRFATEAHNKQLRKDGTTPYVAHLLDVVSRLMKTGASETALIAGWLHDTLEDTEVTLIDIYNNFGPEVAYIIAELSEGDYDPEAPKPSKQERKAQYLSQIASAPSLTRFNVHLVSCADKLSNGLDYIREHETRPQEPKTAKLTLWLYKELLPYYRESLKGTDILLDMEDVVNYLTKIWG